MRVLRAGLTWRLLLKTDVPLCVLGESISRIRFDSLNAAHFAIACFEPHGLNFEIEEKMTGYVRGVVSCIVNKIRVDIWAAHPEMISGWPLYQIDFINLSKRGMPHTDKQYQCHAVSLPIMAERIAEGIKKEPPVIPRAPDINSSFYV